jgi:hypothetical protein
VTEPCGALPRKCLFIYSFIYLLNPPPAVGAQPDPAVNESVAFGVFNGVGISFTPARPMDCSKYTMDRMISEFNRAVPGLGNEPRFFVGTTEIDPTVPIPGQPYSVYPRKIKRPNENRAQLGGAAQPPRIEGPPIEIQWKVSDGVRNQLCLLGHSRVQKRSTVCYPALPRPNPDRDLPSPPPSYHFNYPRI